MEALPLGAKSKEKLQEILATGGLRRNERMAQDERHQALERFLGVWGAGDTTCEGWVMAGYRTLDDLRQHVDLTEQQVGLRRLWPFTGHTYMSYVYVLGHMYISWVICIPCQTIYSGISIFCKCCDSDDFGTHLGHIRDL